MVIYKGVKIDIKPYNGYYHFYLDGLETGRSSTKSGALNMAKKEVDEYASYYNPKTGTRRPLGQHRGMGFYSACPKCGGKIVDEKDYQQGHGIWVSHHINQKCQDCNWSNHIVLD